jgi:signal transduction histidine kinase
MTLKSLSAAMQARRLQLTANIEPDLIRNLEPGLADRAFFALIENAVKYADEGGRVVVTLHTEASTKSMRRMSGADAADSATDPIVFTVENSGPGIASDDLPHIFERFYRADSARRGDGSSFGLGLSIVKETVTRLGGEIDAQSTPGERTRFTIRI